MFQAANESSDVDFNHETANLGTAVEMGVAAKKGSQTLTEEKLEGGVAAQKTTDVEMVSSASNSKYG